MHTTAMGGEFAKKYPALAHLPFILDSELKYHRDANAFLIDRGLGLSIGAAQGQFFNRRVPARQSMNNYAAWLSNFLEWVDTRRLSLESCDYARHVAGRYQKEMLKGIWSDTGDPLSPNTINHRVDQASEFLLWMVSTGRRKTPFVVPYRKAKIPLDLSIDSSGGRTKEVNVRQGKLRRQSVALFMPSDEQILKWLERTKELKGDTVWLMCYTVLLTAMRREEVVCLRTDTLPMNPSTWKVVNPQAPDHLRNVLITIKYGTKGPDLGEEHSDKIGPSRDILIPLTLANLWHEYRKNQRAQAFGKAMKSARGRAERDARSRGAVHLFLRDSDGERFKGEKFGKDWAAAPAPFGESGQGEGATQWSPHSGRHWWACSTLWRGLKKYDNVSHPTNETMAALIENSALSIIRLQVQPQLGHANKETTMLYLNWVKNMLSIPVSLYDDKDV